MHRGIKYFQTMKDIWIKLALKATSPGRTAYAKHQSAIYRDLESGVRAAFDAVGFQEFRIILEGRTLADQVLAWRAEELKIHFFESGYRYVLFKGIYSITVAYELPGHQLKFSPSYPLSNS